MIRVGDITIGEGSPKICAPVVEVTQEDILEEGEKLALSKGVDLIEWRIDFYDFSRDCLLSFWISFIFLLVRNS